MMDRYTLKMRGIGLPQQQQSSSPCNNKNATIRGSSNNSSGTTNSVPKRAPERRGPDAATLLSQLNQLDELATFATNSSIRKGSNAHSSADDNRSIIQISGSSSQEDIDHIVQAVSSKLSISHSVGSATSESYRGIIGPNRSMGSEGTSSHYSNRNVISNSIVTSASKSLAAKASLAVKSSTVGPMLSNSSDDVELSATKWYTRRRTTSVDSVEDSSSEGSVSQHPTYSDDEIFDFGKKILKDDSASSESYTEDSPRRPNSSSSSSGSSSAVMPKKSLDFDDVWEDGEADTVEEAERLTLLESATTESTEPEEDELDEDDDSVSSSSCEEEEVEEYESDDGSSVLFEERSIPPPPPVPASTSIKSQPCESSTLESPLTPDNAAKTENGSDSAEDYSDDEDEGEEGYKLGGYHPVKNGEVYNQRLVRLSS
jgi:hypothetical protein